MTGVGWRTETNYNEDSLSRKRDIFERVKQRLRSPDAYRQNHYHISLSADYKKLRPFHDPFYLLCCTYNSKGGR